MIRSLPLAAATLSPDCDGFKPFEPISHQSVRIEVDRSYWNGTEETRETVCKTSNPLDVAVLDIRGREAQWYSCNQRRTIFTCTTTFRGKPATLVVHPAVVIRGWQGKPGRDSHFHALLIPEGGLTNYHDTFARTITRKIGKAELLLDAQAGGRGENADTDSYYVRVEFLK